MTLDGRQSLSRTHIAIRPTDALYLVLTRDSAWPRRAQRAADSPAAIVHPAAIWSRRVSRGWRCAREDEQQAATRWTARQPDSQTASHTSYSHTNTQPDRHTQRPSHSHARPHARTHTHTRRCCFDSCAKHGRYRGWPSIGRNKAAPLDAHGRPAAAARRPVALAPIRSLPSRMPLLRVRDPFTTCRLLARRASKLHPLLSHLPPSPTSPPLPRRASVSHRRPPPAAVHRTPPACAASSPYPSALFHASSTERTPSLSRSPLAESPLPACIRFYTLSSIPVRSAPSYSLLCPRRSRLSHPFLITHSFLPRHPLLHACADRFALPRQLIPWCLQIDNILEISPPDLDATTPS